MRSTLTTIEAQIIERIKRADRFLIAAHVNPDGDSIGSQLALAHLSRELGAKPEIISHDPAFPKYAFLEGAEKIVVYDDARDTSGFDFAVLLEAPELRRIGDVQNLLSDNCEIINIDHHQDNEEYGAINLVDLDVAAVGILIYRLFHAAGVEVTRGVAESLFTCILTDTGRFRFGSTNSEAMRVCAELLELGADPKKISDALYASYSESQLRMLGELLAAMEIHHGGESCLLVQGHDMRTRLVDGHPEMESLSDYTIYTRGVKIGALIRELSANRTKVSLRSHDPYDVSAIARAFGGGGHRNAAGCVLDVPLEQAREALLRKIEEALQRVA